jgi:hypothetical protein
MRESQTAAAGYRAHIEASVYAIAMLKGKSAGGQRLFKSRRHG